MILILFGRLLQLNPGAQGEDLTSQHSWTAALLLVTRVWPVYLVNEFSQYSMAPYDWANGGFVGIFLDGEYGFTSMGGDTILGNGYGI